MILSTLFTGTKLTLRCEKIDVVASHKVLCHSDDRACQALLSMMVGRVL
jgi:hypothetical protein